MSASTGPIHTTTTDYSSEHSLALGHVVGSGFTFIGHTHNYDKKLIGKNEEYDRRREVAVLHQFFALHTDIFPRISRFTYVVNKDSAHLTRILTTRGAGVSWASSSSPRPPTVDVISYERAAMVAVLNELYNLRKPGFNIGNFRRMTGILCLSNFVHVFGFVNTSSRIPGDLEEVEAIAIQSIDGPTLSKINIQDFVMQSHEPEAIFFGGLETDHIKDLHRQFADAGLNVRLKVAPRHQRENRLLCTGAYLNSLADLRQRTNPDGERCFPVRFNNASCLTVDELVKRFSKQEKESVNNSDADSDMTVPTSSDVVDENDLLDIQVDPSSDIPDEGTVLVNADKNDNPENLPSLHPSVEEPESRAAPVPPSVAPAWANANFILDFTVQLGLYCRLSFVESYFQSAPSVAENSIIIPVLVSFAIPLRPVAGKRALPDFQSHHGRAFVLYDLLDTLGKPFDKIQPRNDRTFAVTPGRSPDAEAYMEFGMPENRMRVFPSVAFFIFLRAMRQQAEFYFGHYVSAVHMIFPDFVDESQRQKIHECCKKLSLTGYF